MHINQHAIREPEPAWLDVFTRSDDETKKEVAIRRELARNLKEARSMSKMACQDVAQWLGLSAARYQNIENGVEPIPAWVIHQCALLFDVSADFLFGHNPDFERSIAARAQRSVLSTTLKLQLAANTATAAKVAIQQRQIRLIVGLLGDVLAVQQALEDALNTLRRHHPEFDDLLGGATLVKQCRNVRLLARYAARCMVRHGLMSMSAFHSLLADEIIKDQ